MTDTDAVRAMAEAAERLVPELGERLRRHGLGEIEVTEGELHVRVVADPAVTPAATPADAAAPAAAAAPAPAAPGSASTPPPVEVASPAVGFFVYADGLGPGQAVGKGDRIGYVEMLGVRHDVHAPRAGVVSHLVAESGEAVEYGQTVVEIEAEAAAR
ncbi:MAG TPA: biotin/lipoyl-containing protein [Candidatus Limnocylindria bacterium]|jgi:acetyl-CoA carboxylase biotin carboxyl carrier protein|nr:biotin/lipoyl-containing protein [Candidatus Limnocylindria bacterium]